MDPFSHIALTSLINRQPKVLLYGLLPDLPWYLLYPVWLWRQRVNIRSALREGAWPLPPSWIRQCHYAAHSLVALLLVAILCKPRARGDRRWAIAWLLHLLVDVPTHARDRMAPRLFWPFSDWAFDGLSWADSLASWLSARWRKRSCTRRTTRPPC
ncbi:MAG: hypothetical protein GX552_11140 [Chloroflexi bacterium]|nr:hypothetical protein [Chloroflexota bacterium]